jgi:CheY-like chemotaxis protein
MAMLLGLLGHEVRVAYAGAPALAMAREFLPRLVLLDLSMPDMGGLEVLKQLRNLAGLEHIAVVAVTGFGTEDDIKRSLAEGFDDHLTKPIEADQLEALISRRCR